MVCLVLAIHNLHMITPFLPSLMGTLSLLYLFMLTISYLTGMIKIKYILLKLNLILKLKLRIWGLWNIFLGWKFLDLIKESLFLKKNYASDILFDIGLQKDQLSLPWSKWIKSSLRILSLIMIVLPTTSSVEDFFIWLLLGQTSLIMSNNWVNTRIIL